MEHVEKLETTIQAFYEELVEVNGQVGKRKIKVMEQIKGEVKKWEKPGEFLILGRDYFCSPLTIIRFR